MPDVKTKYRLFVIIGFTITFTISYSYLSNILSFEALSINKDILLNWINTKFFYSVSIYCLIYVAVVTFSVPFATFLTVSGGFLFGPNLGTLLSVISATTGAAILFLVVRGSFGDSFSEKIKDIESIETIRKGIEKNIWSYMFLIRLIPLIPFWAANIVPALLKVKVTVYSITTFFGILPATLSYSYIGSSIDQSFNGQSPDLSVFYRLEFLFPIFALIILSVIPIFIKRA